MNEINKGAIQANTATSTKEKIVMIPYNIYKKKIVLLLLYISKYLIFY